MSKRDLFSELSTALTEAKQHSEGKLTLRTHEVDIDGQFDISPDEIVTIRETFNMSRGVFAKYLRTSARTLENWEQGRSVLLAPKSFKFHSRPIYGVRPCMLFQARGICRRIYLQWIDVHLPY